MGDDIVGRDRHRRNDKADPESPAVPYIPSKGLEPEDVLVGSVRTIAVIAFAFVGLACSEPVEPTVSAPPMPTTGAMPASPPPSPAAEPPPGEPVAFRTSDGVRIAARTFGDGRVGVVFGHQIDGDQRDWWDLAAGLAEEGYTALTLDFRGYCPREGAGCSEDGGTADAWRDLLAAARLLRSRGAERIVFVGASMGGTAAVLAASRADPAVDGVIALSAPTVCCGMFVEPGDVGAIEAPMLFVAGRDDAEAPSSAREFARWAGDRGRAVVLGSGEHGVDLIGGLATPEVQRRTNALIRTFLERVGAG
jgi:pimeloyl-ACP methyl ester carboxylesterase